MTGRFITLEGIEGAGKSTVAKFVREFLESRVSRSSPRVSRAARRSPSAFVQLVLDRQGEPITPATETLLMFAARGCIWRT